MEASSSAGLSSQVRVAVGSVEEDLEWRESESAFASVAKGGEKAHLSNDVPSARGVLRDALRVSSLAVLADGLELSSRTRRWGSAFSRGRLGADVARTHGEQSAVEVGDGLHGRKAGA